MALELRPSQRLDYRSLNSGEKPKFNNKVVRFTPVLDDTYDVERLVWRRKDKERHGYEYLVKWANYRLEDSTWEPERHLPHHVLESYNPTEVNTDRLRQFADVFERAIKTRLKSRNPKCTVPVELDLFRYVFGNNCSILCDRNDFDKLDLSDHWFYELKKDGIDRKLKFPIKLSVRLCQQKIFVKSDGKLTPKDIVLERCTVFSCTEACDISDL